MDNKKAIEIIREDALYNPEVAELSINALKEENDKWIVVKWRDPTEWEKENYPDYVKFAAFQMPKNGQEILITKEYINPRNQRKERYVCADVCIIDDGLWLEDNDDWEDVLAWRPMVIPWENGNE